MMERPGRFRLINRCFAPFPAFVLLWVEEGAVGPICQVFSGRRMSCRTPRATRAQTHCRSVQRGFSPIVAGVMLVPSFSKMRLTTHRRHIAC